VEENLGKSARKKDITGVAGKNFSCDSMGALEKEEMLWWWF